MAFIRMKTLYKNRATGEVSTDYVSLLPKHLTVDATFKATRFYDHDRALFKEVGVVPADVAMTQQMRKLFNTKVGTREESAVVLYGKLYSRLTKVVYDSWIPGGVHVVMHSSGLDSRMLSWVIKQLHLMHGDSWLGQVLFLCSKWEGNTFKGIMEYEGWRPDQYLVVRNNALPQEYYAQDLMDFEHAWEWSNGASPIAVNLFWYPIRWAQSLSHMPDPNDNRYQLYTGMWGNEILDVASAVLQRSNDNPTQLYTGQWGNTMMDAGSSSEAIRLLQRQYRMFYKSVLCGRPMCGDEVIHPYTDIELVRLVVSSSARMGKRLRPGLCNYMDSHLAEFANESADGDRHRRIADWIIGKMVYDYDRSWYGKKVRPGARPKHKNTEFQAFWSYWTSASLCELLRKGHTIDIAR